MRDLNKFKGCLIGGAVGLQIQTIALNAAISLGVGAIVDLADWSINKLINRSKEIKESTHNLIDTFESLKEETDSLASKSMPNHKPLKSTSYFISC